MLLGLAIRDIVRVDRLNPRLRPGLGVPTGEARAIADDLNLGQRPRRMRWR